MPAWAGLFTELRQSQRQLDDYAGQQIVQARQQRIGIYCERGCCNCCSLCVNCSFPEALLLAQSLSPAQQQAVSEKIPMLQAISLQAKSLPDFLRGFRQQLGGCPLLEATTGSCGCYADRPISCRALISTRNSSWCAVDLATLHPLEKEAFLSSLDPDIVAFPTHYLAAPQTMGRELESLQLTALHERFGLAVSGNLIYQLWLEQEHQLSKKIEKGFAATRAYLEKFQLDLPYLLHFSA